MKQKKVFRELTEDQLGLVVGGTRMFFGPNDCTKKGGTVVCVEGVGNRCIYEGQEYSMATNPRCVEVD